MCHLKEIWWIPVWRLLWNPHCQKNQGGIRIAFLIFPLFSYYLGRLDLINRLFCYRLDQSIKEREEAIVVSSESTLNDIKLNNLHSTSPLQVKI